MFNMWPFLVLNALNGVKNLMQHKGQSSGAIFSVMFSFCSWFLRMRPCYTTCPC